MNLDYKKETFSTRSIELDCFLIPWDTEITGRPVAEISHFKIIDLTEASNDYQKFIRWRADKKVNFCSCRLPHENIQESIFLEEQGFRFIELNYLPILTGLQQKKLPQDNLLIQVANDSDMEVLTGMAEKMFQHGRFHQDPLLGASLGNSRYRTWVANSFSLTHQKIVKCVAHDEIIAFFIIEHPKEGHCFWSLIGLAPDFRGKGLGKRVWQTMLLWHQSEGIDTISTSITSHNIPVFNLYVSLGFRFPAPNMTFHWHAPMVMD